jgi:hypothetical protein
MQGVERAGCTVVLNTLPAAFGLQTESLPRIRIAPDQPVGMTALLQAPNGGLPDTSM